MLALSELNFFISAEGQVQKYLQSIGPAPERNPAAGDGVRRKVVRQKLEYTLEAVIIMLPPLSFLPRTGLASCIARDAYLIARKQLSTDVGACSQTVCKRTHESVLTRKEFMKVSADVSRRWFEVATPALPSKKVNAQYSSVQH